MLSLETGDSSKCPSLFGLLAVMVITISHSLGDDHDYLISPPVTCLYSVSDTKKLSGNCLVENLQQSRRAGREGRGEVF